MCLDVSNTPILRIFFVGLFTVYSLIGLAERADILLNILHKVKEHPFLMITGMPTNRAELATRCQGSIQRGWLWLHNNFFPMVNALSSNGPTP